MGFIEWPPEQLQLVRMRHEDDFAGPVWQILAASLGACLVRLFSDQLF
jgi:hypothetical protein